MTGDKAQARTIRDNELVSANNPFPEIPVTVPQIIRQAGHRTYQRGLAYQRNREVIRYSYDEDERTLTGLVNGSTIIPYEVTVRFFPAVSGSATFTARCTCPVLTDCKHAVALMLTALDRASVAKKALNEHPGPVGVPNTGSHGVAAKSADVAEAKKSADPLAALRASGALTTAANLPAPDAETAEPENPQESFALNELGSSPNVLDGTASKISAWRRDLSSVLSARQDLAGIDSMRVSGALDFSLSVSGSYARGRNMPGATPSINLLARPLMASKTGRWIKGGLSWETFASSVGGPVGRHEIYPEHERFFAELYSIARPWQNMYSSHRDWISISASASTLLWDVLARAEDIGLPLLINGREVNYAVLSPAQVRLHASAEKHAEGAGLQLQAALSWEGREGELLRQLWLPAAHCHPIGTPRTGFFALGGLAQQEYEQAAKAVHWKTARPGALDEVGRESFVQKAAQKDAQEAPTEPSAPTINPAQGERVRYSPAVPELPEGVELALIPLVEPLDAASESLISAGTVHIPAAERATFQKEYLPALSRSIPSLTPDPALALPRVKPPHLVLEISFDEQVRHDAQLSWHWEYPLNPFAEDSAEEASAQEASTQNPAAGSDVYSLPVFGYPGEEGGEIRDERFEARVLRSVRAILAAHPALSGLEERRIEGWETRELLSAILPKLRRVSAVQVRFNGTAPEFVEATDALIEITVSEGNSRDWFGLGIAVKVNNWTVPFAQIFEALDRGADRILLGNGTYFSLRRPEFKTCAPSSRRLTNLTMRAMGCALTATRRDYSLSWSRRRRACIRPRGGTLRCVRYWSWLRAWKMPKRALKRALNRPLTRARRIPPHPRRLPVGLLLSARYPPACRRSCAPTRWRVSSGCRSCTSSVWAVFSQTIWVWVRPCRLSPCSPTQSRSIVPPPNVPQSAVRASSRSRPSSWLRRPPSSPTGRRRRHVSCPRRRS